MNIAICYLTYQNSNTYFNYNILLKHVNNCKNHKIDLYVYNNDDSIEYLNYGKLILFSYKYLKNKFDFNLNISNFCSNTKNKSGLQILPFLDMYINHKEYDIYMFYEDDVLLNINDNFFDKLFDNYNNSDIIFQKNRKLDYGWSWYKSGNNNIKDIYKPYSGLLNIYFIKNELIQKFITDIIDKKYIAHHEYLVNGYFMENDNIKKYYLSDLFNINCQVYVKSLSLNKSNEIIHPIKTIDYYNFYK